MKIPRYIKLAIIADAADLMGTASGKYYHCCNALDHAVSMNCKEFLTDSELLSYSKELKEEFWDVVMRTDRVDSNDTALGRAYSLGYSTSELCPDSPTWLEFRLQMLALYYELVRRGHTFKNFRHV